MNREDLIHHYMSKLDLSYKEAKALLQDDENDISVDLTADQKKVAKEMCRSDRKKETTNRKRERKIDKDKKFLIDHFFALLLDEITDEASIKNPEREIEFNFNGDHYSVTLIKHRKEKKTND